MCHGQMIPMTSLADYERNCDLCNGKIAFGEQHTALSFKKNGEKRTIYVCTRCSASDAWKKHVTGSGGPEQRAPGCG